ncbi:hypothetical protein [Robiginitalea sp. SC105]|uniref:hypothetical protein n=1 Tax=Robiginitalea sp. SC105 TaxID=2762332 RepID=UPI00163B24A1|nr:hypothetical protein [Robiginitalea sp. SC105]MBC2839944.1 hypothetical protein [Robiginitalea sp. SC105]
MKKFSVLSVAAALLFSASALATEGTVEPTGPKTKICAEIGKLLKDNKFQLEDNQELSAWVTFTVNSDKEIVVLSVRTDDKVIEKFVKAKLNYHSIDGTGLESGATYEVPIRFTS